MELPGTSILVEYHPGFAFFAQFHLDQICQSTIKTTTLLLDKTAKGVAHTADSLLPSVAISKLLARVRNKILIKTYNHLTIK